MIWLPTITGAVFVPDDLAANYHRRRSRAG